MSVFNAKTKKVETVESLSKQSEDILGAFMQTATNLSAVNDKIEVLRGAKLAEIERLEKESQNLMATQEKNARFVQKINAFLD